MDSKVRFVILGYGFAGKKHAAALRALPEAEIVALIDPNPAVFAQETERCFATWADFLASGLTADVLNVCTPNGLHITHVLNGLSADLHVVCEKPMGLRGVECQNALLFAQKRQKHIFCVLQNRLSPPIVWLKSLLDEQKLGTIYTVSIQCVWNRDERYYQTGPWRGTLDLDGGPLFTQFSHFLDVLYYLLGEIIPLKFYTQNFRRLKGVETEDSGAFIFTSPTFPLVGSMIYTTAAFEKNMESALTLVGEKGAVKIDGQYMNQVGYCHVHDYTFSELPPTAPPNDYGAFTGSAGAHRPVLQNVIDVLLRGAKPYASAEDGTRTVAIIESIYRLKEGISSDA